MANKLANNLASAGDEGSEVIIDIEDIKCSIYKVPRNLRKVNKEAYIPQLVSIGPYHYNKEELADMQKHKIRYKVAFGERTTQGRLEELKSFIENNEKRIRCHYAEELSEFPPDKFAEMILYDAIFIIELFLRYNFKDRRDENLLNKVWLAGIRRDLQLLENQLPYFVLEELYKLALPSTTPDEQLSPTFRTLSCQFFLLNFSHNRPPYDEDIKITHFTDLCRRALVETQPNFNSEGVITKDLPNAVRLRDLGVKFYPLSDKYLLDIDLEKSNLPFSSSYLKVKIPCLEVNDDTECLIRNLMALEQCYFPSETYICSYIYLLNFLIKTERDVDFFVEKGIISHDRGDNAAVAGLFNKLCLQIPPSNSYYGNIYEDLREQCNNNWNRYRSVLKSTYFSDASKGFGLMVAITALLLTLIQTQISVIDMYKH